MKVCSLCKKEKLLSEFHKKKASKDGYRKQCKSCRKEAAKLYSPLYYSRNKDKIRQYREDNMEMLSIAAKQWRERNKESFRQVKRDWQQRNSDLSNAATAKRRAAKKQATPLWANVFFISEIYALAKMRERLLGGKWQVDHIVPLTSELVCGLHWEQNLQVIREEENKRKHNRYWPGMERLGLKVIGRM